MNIHINYSVIGADKKKKQRLSEAEQRPRQNKWTNNVMCMCDQLGIQAHSEMDVVAQRLSCVTSEIFIPAADQVSSKLAD